MSLENIKAEVEDNNDVNYQISGFHMDLSRNDEIELTYHKLDFTDDSEFVFAAGRPYGTCRMVIDRFSCEWSNENYGTNAICNNGIDRKETTVSSDGTVSVDGYVVGVWSNISIL